MSTFEICLICSGKTSLLLWSWIYPCLHTLSGPIYNSVMLGFN